MAMAMAQLPEELIGEILPQLPVKSLKRFRCISKTLCELIDSPQFVDSHRSKFTHNNSKNLPNLIFQDPSKKKFHVCDVNFDEEDDIIRLGKPVSSPLKLVYGHCKGLLLLYRGKFKFSLWNPSTRKCRNLPDCPLQAPSNNRIYKLIGSGLSYDDSIDDYKAFCIVHVERKIHPKFDIEVWIYQLKSNSWRMSQNWNFAYILCMYMLADYLLPGIGCFIPTDGIIHWICTVNSYKHEIVAFDVRKETYSILPQPVRTVNPDSMKGGLSTGLHVLEGSLCISYVSIVPLQADLYIKKKDGSTWTQLFSVTEPLFVEKIWFRDHLNVLGYSKAGDKIVLDLGMEYLVSYDIKEKSFAKVEIDKDPNWKCPIPYIESLASISGGA